MKDKFLLVRVLMGAMLANLAGTVTSQHANAGSVYAFAQQKIYNMTMLSVGSSSNLTNGSFNISTNTSAGLTGYPGQSFTIPILDAQQSYLGSAPAPVENLSGPAVSPSSENVLIQFNPTPPENANGIVNNVPTIGDFTQPTFARSDSLTWNPPSSTTPPPPPGYLFDPAFAGGNVSIDSAAEALINNSMGVGNAQSGWQINGSFSLTAPDSVQLAFDVIDRLVAFADVTNQVASATTNFSVLITDQSFPFASVYNPSPITASLSFPVIGSATRNDSYNQILNTGILAAGNYNFTITGTTTANVSVVPEPASYVMLGLGLVTFGGLRYRRKLLLQQVAG